MTTAERSARRWAKRDEEIRLLRRALLEALAGADLQEGAIYRQQHADLIARANVEKKNDK